MIRTMCAESDVSCSQIRLLFRIFHRQVFLLVSYAAECTIILDVGLEQHIVPGDQLSGVDCLLSESFLM